MLPEFQLPNQLKLEFALNYVAVQQLILQRYQLEIPIHTAGENLNQWRAPQKPSVLTLERKLNAR